MLTHPAVDMSMRFMGGLLLLLIALPLIGPSITAHAGLASTDGHCVGPDGAVVTRLDNVPVSNYMGYCAVATPSNPSPYRIAPYNRLLALDLSQEAGRSVLPTDYTWTASPGIMYESVPLAAATTGAGAPFLYLLLLLASLVVALRPR